MLPINIPDDFSQEFLNMKRDMEGYQKDFSDFLIKHGASVSPIVIALRVQLELAVNELSKCVSSVSDCVAYVS